MNTAERIVDSLLEADVDYCTICGSKKHTWEQCPKHVMLRSPRRSTPRPKAYMVGDPQTIGMQVGGN